MVGTVLQNNVPHSPNKTMKTTNKEKGPKRGNRKRNKRKQMNCCFCHWRTEECGFGDSSSSDILTNASAGC